MDNIIVFYLLFIIIDILCKEMVWYIIVEMIYDVFEDDLIIGVVLEICELEVYGKFFK